MDGRGLPKLVATKNWPAEVATVNPFSVELVNGLPFAPPRVAKSITAADAPIAEAAVYVVRGVTALGDGGGVQIEGATADQDGVGVGRGGAVGHITPETVPLPWE